MVAAKCLVASVLAAASTGVHAFGGIDMSTLMKLSAMRRQFNQDSILKEQRVALMEHAGFNDMELFITKQIDATDFKASLKQNMKDKLIQNVLNQGGLDITNPFIRKALFGDQDNAELMTRTTPEPLQSIIRLIRTEDVGNRLSMTTSQKVDAQAYGKALLKKYQFQQFNTNTNAFTQNLDEILLAKDAASRKAVLKEIVEQSLYQNVADPIDRSMMFFLTQSRNAATTAEKDSYKQQIKDLQTIKIFQGSVPATSPVSDDNLYAFYRMVNGKVAPEQILNIALGDRLGPIGASELDFERYFGAPAKQFACRAHSDVLRVPCGVNYKADECVAAGCCYNPGGASGVPGCYHDLYGKIGSSLLRAQYVKSDSDAQDAIKGLFIDNVIPTMDKLFKDATPGMAILNQRDPITGAYSPSGKLNNIQYETTNWWDAAHLDASNFEPNPNGPDAFPQRDAYAWKNGDGSEKINGQRPAYGNPRRKAWKAHGPTQSPFFDQLPGVNPTANPLNNGLGTLDEYYRIWLTFAETQDQAQCALIHKSSRVKCMPNYEALVDQSNWSNGPRTTPSMCKAAGCCFNEDAFLEGGHACYRAIDYGICTNLPAGFQKEACPGTEAGISEGECISNPQCCFKFSPKREDPWCFRKYSATLDESQWCSAWVRPEYRQVDRRECFVTTSGMSGFLASANPASNVNNLIPQAHCEAAGCCYDTTLSVNVIEWATEGLGLTNSLFRCFEKRNPAIMMNKLQKPAGTTDIGNEETDLGNLVHGDPTKKQHPGDYSPRLRSCDASKWWKDGSGAQQFKFKRSCGENISYYQCVYVKKCCYKATVANEPACYHPELSEDWTSPV